ncbi:MAG: hypothetical protein KHX24_00310 [Clostridiales bacterium]|jgi:hypothetical protein|nr:hypothetical protein [Clostridiales bacterium]
MSPLGASRSYADAGKAAVLIITSATCATMVIGQATILAAKICFIILYNAAANKEIVRGIAYFPIRTPSPSRLFQFLGILEFLSSSKLFQI